MTDKYTNGLYGVYSRLLTPYIGKNISLLEIGVTSESLMMFESILPDAQVYGFDINIPGLNRNTRAIIETINQLDSEALEGSAVRHGGFDVIIDDGSHFTHETRTCFDVLWKHTREFYVIEDWGIYLAKEFGYYKKYKERVVGMGDLVFEIARGKGVEIVLNKHSESGLGQHSYALFRR